MGFLDNKYKLKSYQERACSFTRKNKKVLLALPTGSGKTLSSTYSIVDTLPSNFRVLFFTETVAIDDIIESMCTFFSKGTFKPESTIGCNFPIREELYSQFVSGEINSIVTTYAILRNDKDYLTTLVKYFKKNNIPVAIVLDEATQVKNEESINHKVAKELGMHCDLVLALTATPISSKLNDIDNIIRCLNTKNYISRDKFRNSFEINTFETEGFLFKVKGSSLYINSEDSALPNKVLKKGKAYFKIPWKIEKHLKPKNIVIHTKKPIKTLINSLEIYIPSLSSREGDFVGDITPYLSYDKDKNSFNIYTPIVKCINDSIVRFRSVGFTITYFNTKTKTEMDIDHLYTFSYEIGGNLVGYKNLTEYKSITNNVLFTLSKDEVGEIPPYVLYKRHYKNDSYTKKAVCSVYESSKMSTTSVARIMIASSAPSVVMEDSKIFINNKAKTLIDDLKSELSNEPIIVFSPLVSVIKNLSEILESKGIEHCVYHGQLSNEEKTRNKNLFKTGKIKIILVSSAAAKGVNLQIARTVIFYDLPFTAEFFQQVSGRVGRLGSTHKSLNIISYIAESNEAIENCLYRNIMGQMNFILKVDKNLIDVNLIDKSIKDTIDPEDSDKYLLSSLGHSKRYYYGN